MERGVSGSHGMGGAYARGVVPIGATYVVFLLFAQYGLLRAMQARLGDVDASPLLAAMGVAGVVASVAVAWLQRRCAPTAWLRCGFLGCALAAAGAIVAPGPLAFGAIAAVTGASLGVVTVTLASGLRELLPGRRFGLGVGLGTGSAYLLCNVPGVFEGAPRWQCAMTVVAALAGLAATWRTAPRAMTLPASASLGPRDYRGAGFASMVASFLALVWLDSAAFAVIQQNAALRGPTWGGDARQWTMGLVHAAAAITAGALIDRGVFRGLLLGAYALFVVAFGGLQQAADLASDGLAAVGPIYAIGISMYSTALVAYPSLWPAERGLVPKRWRSAAVYGVAGWCGSALGVGMAQRLEHIPLVFEVAAGALLLAAWVLPSLDVRRLARSYGVAAGGGAVAMAFLIVAPRQPAVGSTESAGEVATLVERGRRVYLAEGCIHCHSQYVRPGSWDVEAWGPFRPVTGDERPPLLGNRRQGPDLRNVGDRRGAGWQELHLRDPRSTSPGSRMPSYAHLFVPGDRRGEELVAYLESLGVLGAAEAPQPYGTALVRRVSSTRGESASGVVGAGVLARGRALFGLYCATCHGVEGRGDGPLAAALGRKPAMDLRKGAPWLLSWGAGAPPLREELANAIRWGIEGTDMPGHETLGDRDVADLAAWVEVMVEDEWIGGAALASRPGEVRR